MKTLDIRVVETTGEELINQGYSLMSYEGELSLPEELRNRRNVNGNDELTLDGAKLFARDVRTNLKCVMDVTITYSGSGYDVYALSK